MPTLAQIQPASATLTELARAQIMTLIRASSRYREEPGLYPNLAAVLSAADGTVKGQMLNAALALIDSIGDGTVAITGGGDGLDYSQPRDRDQLIDYMLDTLYDQPVRQSSVATGVMRAGRCCRRCGALLGSCGCGAWC